MIAQGNGGSVSIDIDATRTADAMVTTIPASETPNSFERNATALVVQATQTAQAFATVTPGAVQAQAVNNTPAVETEESNENSEQTPDESEVSPTIFAMLMLCFVIVVLVFGVGVFVTLAPRFRNNNPGNNDTPGSQQYR